MENPRGMRLVVLLKNFSFGFASLGIGKVAALLDCYGNESSVSHYHAKTCKVSMNENMVCLPTVSL